MTVFLTTVMAIGVPTKLEFCTEISETIDLENTPEVNLLSANILDLVHAIDVFSQSVPVVASSLLPGNGAFIICRVLDLSELSIIMTDESSD